MLKRFFLEIRCYALFMHFYAQFPIQLEIISFKALRFSISLQACKNATAVTIKVTYPPLPQGLQTELHNADKPHLMD